MESNITSLINNNEVPVNFLGLTKVFRDKKQSELFAKETGSYCLFGSDGDEDIIYCVPK